MRFISPPQMNTIKNFLIPENEKFRLQELHNFSILDTLPEKEYDDITRLASQICETPISLISLIDKDRQWFKSKVGLDLSQTSRKDSFCAHAIIDPTKIFTIKDSREDSRFCNNPLVLGDPRVIFYTGVPLVSDEGLALGTLCVLDSKPKELNKFQLNALKALSNQVVALFELRKNKRLLEKTTKELETRNGELQKFAQVAAHDIKSPLNNISGITQILLSDTTLNLNDEARIMLEMLDSSSAVLRNLVDGILDHSKADSILHHKKEAVNLDDFINQIIQLLDCKKEYQFDYNFDNQSVFINKTALQQIFINLIANGIKYNDKEKVIVKMGFSETESNNYFYIEDNGIGIDNASSHNIFEIFETIIKQDRFGKTGNGIGLSTVKKLINGLNGKIDYTTVIYENTRFNFTIPK